MVHHHYTCIIVCDEINMCLFHVSSDPAWPALSAIWIPGGDEDWPIHRPVQQGLHGLHECVQHLNVAMETSSTPALLPALLGEALSFFKDCHFNFLFSRYCC